MILLNGRSHFSIGESLLSPKDIVQIGVEKGATVVALTDTMRISGMAELVKYAKASGIKPIIGARLRIVGELTHDKAAKKHNKPYYLRVLVRTEPGYRALLKLLSLAFDPEHFYEVPRLLLGDVATVLGEAGSAATLVTLGDFYGAHAAGQVGCVDTLRAAGVAVASEILAIPTAHFARLAYDALMLDGTPCIVAQPTLYKELIHAESFDLMRVITTPGATVGGWVPEQFWRDFTGKNQLEQGRQLQVFAELMAKHYPEKDKEGWFKALVAAYRNNQVIADSCTYVWEKDPASLPIMAPDEFKAVMAACTAGWATRFTRPMYGHTPIDLQPYKERLAYELSVLKRLKFEGYFLLVAKITNWSRENGIAVGPGRGSVGGSLVAYLMGITDIDPLRFGLLFERFINPDRIDLPDADLDFMGTRREEVIAYIRAEFGEEYVAAVSNYMKLGPAAVLKSLCRVLAVPEAGMAFSKLVPKEHGVSIKLAQAILDMPEMAKFAETNPEIVKHALVLEDCMSGYGKHAAGIIVAAVPISDRAVVETRGGERVANWDKRLVEDFGLIKIDILGLSTLDMIEITRKHIFKMSGKKINIHDIPLDDTKVLEAFGKGQTVGVFQFESGGIRALLKNLADQTPLTFDDITAATALYRPGPMDSGQLAGFVDIKKGAKSASYPHPSMEKALRETCGIIVYQEQVMQVSCDLADFTLVQADHLRKIMGKKEKDKMKEWRQLFVDGAVAKHGVDPAFADEIFGQIEKFAGYGFNKSHASAYALISYICMWLKINYPVEFFGGLLTQVKSDRYAAVLADMRRMGLQLLPPDINNSSNTFEPLTSTSLLMPFNAIKGISDNTSNAIMAAREAGPFTSVEDLEKRVEKRKCNTGHRAKLDLVGAFSRIVPGSLPSDHGSRTRDQLALLGGLIDGSVIIDRTMVLTDDTVAALEQVVTDYKACTLCELTLLCHPKPYVRGPARIMFVLDGPSYKEEQADEIGNGGHMEAILDALDAAGLSREDAYITTLIKTPKPQGAKEWSTKTQSECPAWLTKEIEVLKPSLIVALGSKSANFLVRDLKGGISENKGRVIYDKDRDANIVIGFSPGSIYFHPEMQVELNEIFCKLPALLPM